MLIAFEIDESLQFCDLLNRKVTWLLALDNACGIDTSLGIGSRTGGLMSTANAAAVGTISDSNRFGPTPTFKLVTPVRLAPGWFRLAMGPRAWVGAHLEDNWNGCDRRFRR